MKLPTAIQLNKERKMDEYLSTLRSIFISTRWLGIPVYGGRKFIYITVLLFSMLISIEILAIWKLLRAVAGVTSNTGNRGVTARLSGAIFYANSLISLILIWKFLRRWKTLSLYWTRLEMKGLYLQPDRSIKKKVICATCFVALITCVEHGLSMVAASKFDRPPLEWLRRYILDSHGFMLHPDQYNLWVAIIIFIASNIATVVWNFQDLLVILISMGLTSRYHRLNTYVKNFVAYEKNLSGLGGLLLSIRINTWRKLRESYVRQAVLVRKVDQELGALTILCSLNNFYFICLQSFIILKKSDGAPLNDTYYIVSAGWLIFRAISVVLSAANVNLYSKQALTSIHQCPSYGYNIEIKRLNYYLTNDNVCLSGLGIFFMHRQTLLEVAAAIVKYELILINFDT